METHMNEGYVAETIKSQIEIGIGNQDGLRLAKKALSDIKSSDNFSKQVFLHLCLKFAALHTDHHNGDLNRYLRRESDLSLSDEELSKIIECMLNLCYAANHKAREDADDK